MSRKILVVLAVVLVCANVVLAKDEKAKQQAQAPEQLVSTNTTTQQEKDLLIGNINNMRNQELRVAVLQQLLNEEVAKLRNVQAVFCDQYKLDIDKFRQGLYRYDDKTGKFVETEPLKPQK